MQECDRQQRMQSSKDRDHSRFWACVLQTGSLATDNNVLYRQEVWLQRAMCSTQEVWLQTESEATERKCGYRQQCALQKGSVATDRKCGYRQQCTLQTGSEATDSNVLYRHKVWRQSGNVVMSVKLQWGYLPVLQSPTVACLYRL